MSIKSVDVIDHKLSGGAATPEEPSFTFLPLGAIIQNFKLGDVNIVQNFATAEQYKQFNAPYFGETIGRVANRIAGAKINNLNGQSYELTANNGPNSLHGGVAGWGKRVWEGPVATEHQGKQSILFKYLSKDGEEGFPGTVEVRVWYTSSTEMKDGKPVAVLEAEYEAELLDDSVKETAVAVTNHSYFNLAAASTIEGTEVTLSTNLHHPVDKHDIPLGPIEPYPGIEANKTFVLGPKEPDVDHCFIMNTDSASIPLDTRILDLETLASFYHPTTKVHLEIQSTEPAFQFYTGKYIDVPATGDLPARGARSGFCVEPSRYIDAVNRDEWKGMVVLKKGERYGCRTVYRGWRDS